MEILIFLYRQILKAVYDYNISVTPTLFALKLPELLSTMHPLANIDSSSFLGKTFHALVVYTLLNLGSIFCMIVGGLTTIGIWGETPLLTSPYSLNLTAELFPSEKTLLHLQAFCCYSDVMCCFILFSVIFPLSFILCCSFLSSSFSCFHLAPVCLYVVMK